MGGLQQRAIAPASNDQVGMTVPQIAQLSIDIFLRRDGADPLLPDAFLPQHGFENLRGLAGMGFAFIEDDNDFADFHVPPAERSQRMEEPSAAEPAKFFLLREIEQAKNSHANGEQIYIGQAAEGTQAERREQNGH